MTLKELVQIVVETIEEIRVLYEKQIQVLCFDENNQETLLSLAKSINGSATIMIAEDIGKESKIPAQNPDYLFIDYIPPCYLPELALGLYSSPFSTYINSAVLQGTQIFIQNYTPIKDAAPMGLQNLFHSYEKILASYGYVFYNSINEIETMNKSTLTSPQESGKNQMKVYTKPVLSRSDVIENAYQGVLWVHPSVIITDLAKETAAQMKIDIKR